MSSLSRLFSAFEPAQLGVLVAGRTRPVPGIDVGLQHPPTHCFATHPDLLRDCLGTAVSEG